MIHCFISFASYKNMLHFYCIYSCLFHSFIFIVYIYYCVIFCWHIVLYFYDQLNLWKERTQFLVNVSRYAFTFFWYYICVPREVITTYLSWNLQDIVFFLMAFNQKSIYEQKLHTIYGGFVLEY